MCYGKALVAAILKGAYDEMKPGNKKHVRNQAHAFIMSDDCEYMCGCVDIDYTAYKEKSLKEYNKL